MRSLFIVALASVLALLAPAPAEAWWCTGHMTVAQVARLAMTPKAAATMDTIMGAFSASGPFPKAADMVQAACWADDLKDYKVGMMNEWHFIDQPYNPDHLPIPKDPITDENVETVIAQLQIAIKANRNLPSGWVMGYTVAELIHFYGDIHQPLHAAQKYSHTFPNGDKGGNEYKVILNGETTNLHAIWDSVCGAVDNTIQRPLNTEDKQKIVNLAQRLMSTYKFTNEQKKEYNSTVMATESYNYAVSTAYPGITNGITITQDYINKCIPVAEARVALAGWRLANEFNYLFAPLSVQEARSSEHQEKLAYRILRRLAALSSSIRLP